jgi:hypothetical protein
MLLAWLLPLPVECWDEVLLSFLSPAEVFDALQISSAFWKSGLFAKALVKREGFHFQRLAPALRQSAELHLFAIENFHGAQGDFEKLLQTLPPAFWEKELHCRRACGVEDVAFAYVPALTRQSEAFMLSVLRDLHHDDDNKDYLVHFTQLLQTGDRGLALECASKCTNFLEMWPHWAEDRDFVLQVLRLNPMGCGDFMLKRLRACTWFGTAFILEAVTLSPAFSTSLAPACDPLLAVNVLSCLSALARVSGQRSTNCRFVRALSRDTRDAVWRRAVQLDPWVVSIIDARCICAAGDSFVADSLRREPATFAYMPRVIRLNFHWARTALSLDGLLLGHRQVCILWSDVKSIVLAAVSQNGLALEYASAELRGDLTVVEAAVRQNGLALAFVVEKAAALRLQLAVLQRPGALAFSKCYGLERETQADSFCA